MSRVLNAKLRLQSSLCISLPFSIVLGCIFPRDLGLHAFLWRHLLHLVAFHGEFVQFGELSDYLIFDFLHKRF